MNPNPEDKSEGSEDGPVNKAHRSDLLARPTRKENQAQVLYTAADYIQYTPGAEEHLCSDVLQSFPALVGMNNLICELHDAPLLLRKEVRIVLWCEKRRSRRDDGRVMHLLASS